MDTNRSNLLRLSFRLCAVTGVALALYLAVTPGSAQTVNDPDLQVSVYYQWTSTTSGGANDLRFGPGVGDFGNDLFVSDTTTFSNSFDGIIWRLKDLNGDGDAMDAGESTNISAAPIRSPISIDFGFGGDMYIMDYPSSTGLRFVYKLTNDVAPVITQFTSSGIFNPCCLRFFDLGGAEPEILIANANAFSSFGGQNDGQFLKVAAAGGSFASFSSGANISEGDPMGWYDNNAMMDEFEDGWIVGRNGGPKIMNGPVLDGSLWAFKDLNMDNDADDVGESRQITGRFANSIGAVRFDPAGIGYFSTGTQLWRVEDLNMDGDFWDFMANDWDAGEQSVFAQGFPGSGSIVDFAANGDLYMTRTDTGTNPPTGLVYVIKSVQQNNPLQPADLGGGDNFARAVAVDGNRIVVGIPNRGSGVVRVYETDGRNLVQTQEIPVPDGFVAASFGASVAIEGDLMVIGAPGAVVNKGTAASAMAALIMQRLSGGGWMPKGDPISPPENGNTSRFGTAVSISAGLAVIGAPEDDDEGNEATGSGAAYLYNANGPTPVLETRLKPTSPVGGQRFGAAVANRGGNVAIGSPGGAFAAALAGAVDMYRNMGTGNVQSLGTLTGSASSSGSRFGAAVDMSGSQVVVGAPQESDNRGAAYVFGVNSLVESARLQPAETATGDRFGAAVAVDDKGVVVGAPDRMEAGMPGGAAYVYDSGLGEASSKIVALPGQQGLGSAVDRSTDRIIIGAPTTNAEAGAAVLRADVRRVFAAGFE